MKLFSFWEKIKCSLKICLFSIDLCKLVATYPELI